VRSWLKDVRIRQSLRQSLRAMVETPLRNSNAPCSFHIAAPEAGARRAGTLKACRYVVASQNSCGFVSIGGLKASGFDEVYDRPSLTSSYGPASKVYGPWSKHRYEIPTPVAVSTLQRPRRARAAAGCRYVVAGQNSCGFVSIGGLKASGFDKVYGPWSKHRCEIPTQLAVSTLQRPRRARAAASLRSFGEAGRICGEIALSL
jgi:hypothetical protein